MEEVREKNRKKKKEKERRKERRRMDTDVGGDSEIEEEREGKETHAVGRSGSCHDDLSRISRAVAAASSRTAQSRRANRPSKSPPVALSPFGAVRRVATYGARGSSGGAHRRPY